MTLHVWDNMIKSSNFLHLILAIYKFMDQLEKNTNNLTEEEILLIKGDEFKNYC